MADGGMVALDVRRRTAVAGCRATWPDHPGYAGIAGALRTGPPTLWLDRCAAHRNTRRRISARPSRETRTPSKCAPGRLPGAPAVAKGRYLDLPAFRRFYMITARAGHTASHTSNKALPAMLARPQRSPPPGRQVLEFTRRRRRKSANQPAHITTVCGGFVAGHRLWRAGNGGERSSG